MTGFLISACFVVVGLAVGVGLGYAWRAKIAKKLSDAADAVKKV